VDESSDSDLYHKTILSQTENATSVGNPMGIAVDPLNGWEQKLFNITRLT